jgi:shikimate dehydrogenase
MSDFFSLGLLGHPLTHSLSPCLHAAALQYAGLKGQYLLFDIRPEDFENSFTKMLQQGTTGFNVTIPYKQKVLEKMHELTPEALQTGAVNTVRVTAEGKLSGHNTDVTGFKSALVRVMYTPGIGISGVDAQGIDTQGIDAQGTDTLQGKSGLVIGTGGAARAAIVALKQLGLTTIKIRGRDLAKVNALVSELTENRSQSEATVETPQTTACRQDKTYLELDDDDSHEQLSIVVNASSIGLLDDNRPEWMPVLVNRLSQKCICFDMVYHKDKTSPIFTKLAQQRSLPAVDGLPMLVHQARLAFEYWTGVGVPCEIMYAAL